MNGLDSNGSRRCLKESVLEIQILGLEATELLGLKPKDINCLEKQLEADLQWPARKTIRPFMSLRPSPFHLAMAQGPPPGPQSSDMPHKPGPPIP